MVLSFIDLPYLTASPIGKKKAFNCRRVSEKSPGWKVLPGFAFGLQQFPCCFEETKNCCFSFLAAGLSQRLPEEQQRTLT